KRQEFPMTKMILKILKHLPSKYDLDSPVHITTEAEAKVWIQELSKLNHRLNTEAMTEHKDRSVERMLDNCEKATNRETSDTRAFFKKVSGLIYKTTRRAPQQVVDVEIPSPTPQKAPIDEPKSVMSEISRFWRAVFQKRVTMH